MPQWGNTLVTGSSGFVGSHLVKHLIEKGVPVRTPSRGDLSDPNLLRGVDTVVHLAGLAHKSATLENFRTANRDLARRLADRSRRSGVRSFILLSSAGASASTTRGTPITESDPASPSSAYGRSKLEGEQAVREATMGMHAAILRPPMIYGPGMKGNPLRLFGLIAKGLPLPFGAIENLRSILFIGNLLAAFDAVMESGAAETFFVSDGQDVSTPELAREIGRSLKKTPPIIRVPVSIFRSLRYLKPEMIDGLTCSLQLDTSRLRRMTRYAPPYTREQGLAETAKWFVNRQSNG